MGTAERPGRGTVSGSTIREPIGCAEEMWTKQISTWSSLGRDSTLLKEEMHPGVGVCCLISLRGGAFLVPPIIDLMWLYCTEEGVGPWPTFQPHCSGLPTWSSGVQPWAASTTSSDAERCWPLALMLLPVFGMLIPFLIQSPLLPQVSS